MLFANLVAHMLGVTLMVLSVTKPDQESADPKGATERARDKVEAWLKEVTKNASLPAPPTITVVDDAVRRLFPDDEFYAVRFMKYPRAVKPPAPLALENLVRVNPDGRVERIENLNALQKLFEQPLKNIRNEDDARTALLACLRLVQELYQDGYYTFTVPQDSVSIIRRDNRLLASGKAVVTKGGRGAITVTLTTGVPCQFVVQGKVRPDVRPR